MSRQKKTPKVILSSKEGYINALEEKIKKPKTSRNRVQKLPEPLPESDADVGEKTDEMSLLDLYNHYTMIRTCLALFRNRIYILLRLFYLGANYFG